MNETAPSRRAVTTDGAPAPAGTYSQAVVAGGFVYIAGQTPRRATGERAMDLPFDEQVELVMGNIEAIAAAAQTSLREAVHVTVFLKDMARAAEFDRLYSSWVADPPPARLVVPAALTVGDLEVTAVCFRGH